MKQSPGNNVVVSVQRAPAAPRPCRHTRLQCRPQPAAAYQSPIKGVMLVALALLSSMLGFPALASVDHILGIARDVSDDSVRYIEHHQHLADGSRRVDYYSPSMDLLAFKRLTYPGLPQHPQISQKDLQEDVQVEVTQAEGMLTMRRTTSDSTDTSSFPLSDSMVVDAGFDQYIRTHWEQLLGADEVQIDFAVAGMGRLLPVNVKLDKVLDGKTWFSIEPANWFIRALVPEIFVGYDSQRRLSAYRGVGGVKRQSGDSKIVTVKFDHYQLDEALDAPLQGWLPESLALAR